MSQPGLEQNVAVDTNRGLFSAIVSVAAGLELNSTLRRIITNAVELVDASYGALGVLDEDGIVQEFIHVGIPADEAERIGDLPQGDGILGLLIDHPVPIRLPDLRQHPASIGFPNNHPVMTTFLGVPVRVRGEVFGNLYLTEKRNGQYFTAEDERTVMALAAAAAVAASLAASAAAAAAVAVAVAAEAAAAAAVAAVDAAVAAAAAAVSAAAESEAGLVRTRLALRPFLHLFYI
jgi:GAF domain-containing protein